MDRTAAPWGLGLLALWSVKLLLHYFFAELQADLFELANHPRERYVGGPSIIVGAPNVGVAAYKPDLVEGLAWQRVRKLPDGWHEWLSIFVERKGMNGVRDTWWNRRVDESIVKGQGIEFVEYTETRDTERT